MPVGFVAKPSGHSSVPNEKGMGGHMNEDSTGSASKMTVHTIREKKARHEPITFLTAYDYPTGRLVDEAGVDMVLVGDTLAEVVLGYENTLPVTFEAMLHHTAAVRRGVKRALLVADLPFGSYQADEQMAIRLAVRFVKEAGAEAVKLEGGEKRVSLIRRLLDTEIPVMGHLGLTPQSVHRFGGYRSREGSLATRSRSSGMRWPWTAPGSLPSCSKGFPANSQR